MLIGGLDVACSADWENCGREGAGSDYEVSLKGNVNEVQEAVFW